MWARAWTPKGGGVLPTSGEAGRRVEELGSRYPLELLKQCGQVELAESLYVLDLCDRFLKGSPIGRALDVGSKNGAYLPGLSAFRAGWDAVELAAERYYWDLTSRRTVGEGVASLLPDCRYLAGDVRDLKGSYACITWFLPFVFVEPHQAWGLREKQFEPEGVLKHVLGLLESGGWLLIINQGEEEYQEQGRLLEGRGEGLGEIGSVLSPFKKRRFGWRVQV